MARNAEAAKLLSTPSRNAQKNTKIASFQTHAVPHTVSASRLILYLWKLQAFRNLVLTAVWHNYLVILKKISFAKTYQNNQSSESEDSS